jgi:hypothetical protein
MRIFTACDPEEIGGYAFTYGHGRRISHSTPVSWTWLNENTRIGNRGPGEYAMVVLCRDCNTLMEYEFGHDGADLAGRYFCPRCGLGLRESTLYNQLERENDQFETL